MRWSLAENDQPRLFERSRRITGSGEYRSLTFWEVESKSIINPVPKAAGLPFEYTINPYRGCSHACAFCFARPTHDYLGFDIAEDFDTQIVVKTNAIELARAETAPGRWAGHPIAMGTNTDPYQKAEGKYRLTRGIIETLLDRSNPFSILTKSTLVLRDIDLLTEAADRGLATVDLSIPTLDEEVWRLTEPGTPHPRHRIDAVRRLNAAGIPSGVLVAPLIPYLSDRPDQVDEVMTAARNAGARFVTPLKLHLRPGLRPHWFDWLAAHRPDLVEPYEELYRNRSYLNPRPRTLRNGWSRTQPPPAAGPTQLRLGLES